MKHHARALLAGALTLVGANAAAQTGLDSVLTTPVSLEGDTYFEVFAPQPVSAGSSFEVWRYDGNGGFALFTSQPLTAGRNPVFVDTAITLGEGLEFRVIDPDGAVVDNEVVTGCVALRGDANVDLVIDIEDVLLLLRHLGYLAPLPDDLISPLLADVDANGLLELGDAIYLYDYLTGIGAAPVPVPNGLELSALYGDGSSANIPPLLAAMGDATNPYVADQATRLLYEYGDAAVSALIAEAAAVHGSGAEYRGSGIMDERVSVEDSDRLAAAYLMLVDCMREGAMHRFGGQDFVDPFTGLAVSDTTLGSVINAYQGWDFVYAGVPLSDRTPVDLTAVGAELPHAFPRGFDADDGLAPQNGTPKKCSDTPRRNRHACSQTVITTPSGARYVKKKWKTFRIKIKTGSDGKPRVVPEPCDVYNCFAWAMGCQTDAWVEPQRGPGGYDLGGMLEGNGYDSSKPSDKPTGCKGEILILCIRCYEGPWIPWHGMKRMPDGTWSSKNGHGPLYEGITDPEAFCKEHYQAYCPVPPPFQGPPAPAEMKFKYYCPK